MNSSLLISNGIVGAAHYKPAPKRSAEFREYARELRDDGKIAEAKEFEAFADKVDIVVEDKLTTKRQEGERVESLAKGAGIMRGGWQRIYDHRKRHSHLKKGS